MSPDYAIIIFTSLGFAAVFLALIIGMDREEAEAVLAHVSSMTPGAKREAKIRKLDDMTQLADEAIQARELGKRMPQRLEWS